MLVALTLQQQAVTVPGVMGGFIIQPRAAALFVVRVEPVFGDAPAKGIVVVAPVFGMGEAALLARDGDAAELVFGVPLQMPCGVRAGLFLDAVAPGVMVVAASDALAMTGRFRVAAS